MLRSFLKALGVAPRKAVQMGGLFLVFTTHLNAGYHMQNGMNSTSEQTPELQAGLVIGSVSFWLLRGRAAAVRRCCLTPNVITETPAELQALGFTL